MRWLYGAGMGLAGGVWLAGQVLKGEARRAIVRQRLAWRPPTFPQPPLWLHAASLGEVGVATVLVARLRVHYPRLPLLLTTFTETGLGRAEALEGVTAQRLPLDWAWVMRRFLNSVAPRALWVVETELWPNLLTLAQRRGIPTAVVNARLSAGAVGRYRRLAPLFSPVAAGLATVAARSEEDAARWRALGVRPVALQVTGNVKFDLDPGEDLEARRRAWWALWGEGRAVWVAGSVRPEEEGPLLIALRRVRERMPGSLLVWAPRHPQRFEAVARELTAQGVSVARRSRGEAVKPDTEVLLLDTLGELAGCYAAARLAFVGGTLSPRYGGHSPVEPAALGLPVLMGPHRAHFKDEAAALEAAGGLVTVADGEALGAQVAAWLQDPQRCHQIGERARAVVAANRGAADRTVEWFERRCPGVLAADLSAATG